MSTQHWRELQILLKSASSGFLLGYGLSKFPKLGIGGFVVFMVFMGLLIFSAILDTLRN